MKAMLNFVFAIVFIIGVFLFVAETKITFKPFSIEFGDLPRTICLFVLFVALTFYNRFTYLKGKRDITMQMHKIMEHTPKDMDDTFIELMEQHDQYTYQKLVKSGLFTGTYEEYKEITKTHE